MSNTYLKPGGSKDPRDVDRLASKTRSLWSRTYVFIKKANVKTWKKVFILAFIAGAIAASVWMIALKIQTITRSAGETAILDLNASSTSVAVGETFKVAIALNTNSNKVVAAKVAVDYDPQYFQLVSWDTSSSTFADGNACQYEGKACEIVSSDAVNGKISITVAKPTPGVSSATATVGTLDFKALKPVSPTTPNLKLAFVSQGNYDDSDVIFDDGKGTDILASVTNETVVIKAPICTSFTYSDWGTCQADGTQTRTVTSSSPSGCTGGDPVLTQGCSTNPSLSTCTSFKYSKWSACINGTRTRTVTRSIPAGCTDGTPILSQACKGGK